MTRCFSVKNLRAGRCGLPVTHRSRMGIFCRAGSETSRYFGNDLTQLNEHAWWGGESRIGNIQGEKVSSYRGDKEIQRFRPLRHVWQRLEWCQDSYDPFGYRTRTGTTPDRSLTGEHGMRGSWWFVGSEFRLLQVSSTPHLPI
jgi:hypothetical protein